MKKTAAFFLLLWALPLPAETPPAPAKRYLSVRHHVQFDAPMPATEKCLVGDICMGCDDRGDCQIFITFADMNLEDSLHDEPSFEKMDGKWSRLGSQGARVARPIHGQGWKGMVGVADCGSQPGVGIVDCTMAILSDGVRAAKIETASGYPDPRLTCILNSFRFFSQTR